MKKQMLMVTGAGNTGKSTAIKLAYGAILGKAIAYQGPTKASYLYLTVREVGLVVKIGMSVGIATRGDSSFQVTQGLNYFLSQKCKVIVCATRSRGAPRLAAENFAKTHGFTVTAWPKARQVVMGRQLISNTQFSRRVSTWVCRVAGI